MPIIRSNAIRIKRFRELKESLRTNRDRLLVGIDIAKDQHVAQVKVAHGRVLVPQLAIPNTPAGFMACWRRLHAQQGATGLREIVCALEPTGTYHQALALFWEQHGVDVLLVPNQVAHFNRRPLDGTWDKSDSKDAANLCDLLERGRVCFYSLPDGPVADLRRLVRLLRKARVELGACKTRFRNTLLPALAPAGAPAPPALVAPLPAPLRALLPTGERRVLRPGRPAGPPLPPGVAAEFADLTARLAAVQARITHMETTLVQVAAGLPAYALLQTLPGVGPTVAAILLAAIGEIGWYSEFPQLRKLAGLDIIRVQSGRFAGTARISKAGRSRLRWALYQAAMGAARSPAWRTRRDAMRAKRRGDRYAFFKANIELAAKLLRLVWGVWRSGRPYDPRRVAGGSAARPATAPPAARAGRRGAPPSAIGQPPIGEPRGTQAGRISDRGALYRRNRTSASP
jgi:transposase